MILRYTTPLRLGWVPARRPARSVRWALARSRRAARNAASARGEPMRPNAQAAWPRTSGLPSAVRASVRAGTSARSRPLPSATAALRRSTAAPRQPIAVSRRRANERPRRRSSAWRSGSARSSSSGANAAPPVRPARMLGGHASLHKSQPQTHVPTSGRRARGIASRRWVRSLMQRVASIVRSPRSAPVGQASTQRVHAPHEVRSGGSGSSSSVVTISPKNTAEPRPLTMRLVCLPIQPNPARAANARSASGAVSQATRVTAVSSEPCRGASASMRAARARKHACMLR